MTEAIIAPLPERIRCTACPMVTSSSLLELAPCTMAWLLLDGFWFCEACRSAAPYIVALDRERNAHQVTMLRLDEANDEIVRHRVLLAASGPAVAALEALGDECRCRREADLYEAAANHAAAMAEIGALRCGDLGAFHDGELSEARTAAFRAHLAGCATCAADLIDLTKLDAVMDAARSEGQR